ncbi:hypothetical protein PFISCL1PPCAC_6853, partial [Pristionchus fissidentatus]
IGQESFLRLNDEVKEEVVNVAGNRDRSLIALITPSAVYIYNAQPSVLLCVYRQPDSEVAEKGEFVRAYWQFDSVALAVTTKKTHLLIFSVHFDADERSYGLRETEESEQLRSRLRLSKDGLPSVFVQLNVVVNTSSPISCAVPNRDELLICGANGFVHHLQWNGKFDNGYSFQLSKIPFAHDQLQSKPAFLPDNSPVFIRDIAYAPLSGGYSLVLSDGRAALLTSNDPKFHPNTLLAVWAVQLRDAVVADTNHRFRSLLFGCANGDVTSYHVDDSSGALLQTFRVALSVKNGPELSGRLGPVRCLRVLPQNGAIAVVWESGGKRRRGATNGKSHSRVSSISGLPGSAPSTSNASSPSSAALNPLPPVCAILSPMGAQWWSSLEGNEEENRDENGDDAGSYNSIDWGPEGYQVWLGGSKGASLLQMTRSASFGNPYMEHSNRVVLIGPQRIYISPLRSRELLATSPHSVWSAVDVRPEYLHANWPIRFASLDRESGRTLVVAGTSGLSFCSLANQRWKIFGNESQERELHVTGGLFVWRGLMVGACAETAIKLYPIETRLDERFASTKETDARIIMSNMKGDILVTMDVESRLLMYTLTRCDVEGERDGHPRATMERTAEIRIGELIPHIACLVSVHLTVLTYDKGTCAIFVPGVDTVLLNISGRLYTLTPKAVTRDETNGVVDEENRFQLNQPATIASFVEQVWHDRAVESRADDDDDEDTKSSPLRNALWINCGARGSHVWLPLLTGRTRSANLSLPSAGGGGGGPLPHHHDSFLSRRIMIPFGMEINPALMASGDCVATGVESTPAVYSTSLTLYTPHRNSEVFIHHLLRQLLKRNLGMFALDLAESFRYLPYFTHSLELLLHNVLEEEATSAEPIPDPLLPRVVAFIQEFPEFLKTIAHCARKTELALWPALFEVTGAPNDLFEVCLRDGQLETAASYLIILQNIESATVSLEQSAHLLRESLSSCSWQLARDLVRFAKSIDAEDMEQSPARSPPPLGSMTSIQGRRPSRGSMSVASKGAAAADELVLARFQAAGKVGRLRHSHSVSEGTGGKEGTTTTREVTRKDSASSKRILKAQSSDLSPSSPHSPNSTTTNAMLERMNRLIHDHARGLLEEYCVRDLGCLCSHLEMDAPALLASIASTSLCPPPSSSSQPSSSSPLRIADWSVALQRVHSQFEWPYPVASSRVVEQLAKRFAGIRSSASVACMSDAGSEAPTTPTSMFSKKASRDENSLPITPIDEATTDQENASSVNGEVVAIMERVTGLQNGYGIGQDYRSGSPSSMRTSGVTMDEVASMNGGMGGGLQMEPLLGPSEAVKGNEAREAQLRYMLGAFSEIAAMDWVFLLCVVLRDAAVARASLSVAAGRRAGAAAMLRLRIGCRQLIEWAGQNCIGYVHILHVFDGHLSILCEALGPAESCSREEQNAADAAAAPAAPILQQPKPAAATEPAAAAQLMRSRALRDAFGSPGGAVRSSEAQPGARRPPIDRESGAGGRRAGARTRSRSVDRGAERTRERQMRVGGGEEAVSTATVEEGKDCVIM